MLGILLFRLLVIGQMQAGAEHRAIDARHAVLITQPLVGIDELNQTGRDVAAADAKALRAKPGIHVARGELRSHFRRTDAMLNGILNVVLVPAFADDLLPGGFRRQQGLAEDTAGALEVGGVRRQEDVLAHRIGPDHRPVHLLDRERHRCLAVLRQLLDHALRLLGADLGKELTEKGSYFLGEKPILDGGRHIGRRIGNLGQ